MTIPKIIHYCWFGNTEKPKEVIKYIEGWRKILPKYEIIEWNEKNFNVSINKYVAEAYNEKKYAFVSDYARLFALYRLGGIYLDTDVEVVKSLDDLLNHQVVVGFEEKNYVATSTILAEKESPFIKSFMDLYHKRRFISSDGTLDLTTNVIKMTNLLFQYGLVSNGEPQKLSLDTKEAITVLEQEKLSPYDYIHQIDKRNNNTYTIHHFGATWAKSSFKFKRLFKYILIKLIGIKLAQRILASFR